MIQIGEIHIHVINDSIIRSDPGGPFGLVPKALWSRHGYHDEDFLIPMAHHCLLVQTQGKNILVDTGQGDKLGEREKQFFRLQHEGGLLRSMAVLGVTPADIDIVVNTHLHSDHCNGNTRFKMDGSGEMEPTFPNAEYLVQRREYEDATHPNERTRATYLSYNFQPLVESGQMRLLDGNTQILPGIDGIVTPGHTPGHMSVRFESQGQYGAFLCDMATFAVHFEKLAWMTAYDVEPLVTLETKRRWQEWALETNALLFFTHDVNRPVGRLVRDEKGKIQVEKVETLVLS